MIEVSLTNLIFIPLAFNLLLLGFFHVYYLAVCVAWGVQCSRSRGRLYRCQVCRHVYVDQRDVPLARCHRCGCLNEAVRR